MSSSYRHPYSGRWIARISTTIIACGGTPRQVYNISRSSRFKEIPILSYIPPQNHMIFPDIFFQLQKLFETDEGIYLVGGAVRDGLLGLPIHDLDFVCLQNTRLIARTAANFFHGAFYVMDEERQIFRVLVDDAKEKIVMDFASLRGSTLEEDLKHRDFSINAIAVDLQDPQKLYDPTGGAQALVSRSLSMCSPDAMTEDPIRVIRGIRLAGQFGLKIEPSTREMMKVAVPGLANATVERIRDELFKIADLSEADVALKALIWLGCHPWILPVLNKWQMHNPNSYSTPVYQSIAAYRIYLDMIIHKQEREIPQDAVNAVVRAGLLSFRIFLLDWFSHPIHPDRSRRSLLIYALAHLHAHIISPASDLPYLSGEAFHLSNPEKSYLKKVSDGVMRILKWHSAHHQPSNIDIYRYFRDFGSAGVDACIAALSYEIGLIQQQKSDLMNLEGLIGTVSKLMITFRDRHNAVIDPPIFMDGGRLMQVFELTPGPMIGELLELIRECQVSGEVRDEKDIPVVVKRFLELKINQG